MSNLAVVGSPITHSKSPILQLAAYRALGLDWSYVAHEVASEGLTGFVSGLDETWRGLSVTMPLKREAFELAASHDAHAQYTGVANTLAFSYVGGERVARGYNTDVFGIVSSLAARGLTHVDHAVLIGGGATAISALVALDELGFQSTTVALRDETKATPVIELAARLGMDLTVISLNALSSSKPADVAISTTPGSAEVRLSDLPRSDGAILLDVAYDVWPSPRAHEWNELGGASISGLSMLAFQALKQVRIFVADSPDNALANESDVAAAMFASVGLSPLGL